MTFGRFFSSALLTGLLMAGGLQAVSSQAQENASSKKERPQVKAESKLDLNTAPEAALAAVPVIGRDGARAIIAARPFKTINELDRITGFSAERLEQIRAQVVVKPELIPPEEISTAVLADPTPTSAPKEKVNINTAPFETLAALAPVGPKTAGQIIAARPFHRLDELNQLDGISTERLAHLKLVLTIVPTAEPESDQTEPPATSAPQKP